MNRGLEGLERFLKPLEELFAIRDELREIANKKQAVNEAEGQLAKRAKDIKAADAKVQAREEAALKAEERAAAVESEGQAKADAIVAQAHVDAALIASAARDSAKSADGALAAARAKMSEAKAAAAEALALRDKANAERADVERALAALRAKIG
jgi:hypothetical protein